MLAARIAALEAELQQLRQQQRADLLAAIRGSVAPGVVFSSADLLRHAAVDPALAAAFSALNITSPRRLGKWLQRLRGSGIERVGVDHDGAIWMCSE
jgi:hypothetical protein